MHGSKCVYVCIHIYIYARVCVTRDAQRSTNRLAHSAVSPPLHASTAVVLSLGYANSGRSTASTFSHRARIYSRSFVIILALGYQRR